MLALHPDRDHPVSGGFACHKGTSFHHVHHDPNRLDHPLRRANPKSEPQGRFERVSWDDAFAEIGERLRGIRSRYGTEAVGCYWGNPLAYAFWAKMQSTRLFGGLTQDLSNKFAAIDAIRGIRARGGGVTFVNPRRIRAVELGLGDHLQIRPDTDVYLLAALLTETDRLGGWGVNVNRLLPSGPGSYETYSSMAFMVGVPVDVVPLT